MIVEDIISMLRQRDLYEDARRVARTYNVTVAELVGRGRASNEAAARHAFIAELFSRGHWSKRRLSQVLGLDRSTVLYAIRKHEKKVLAHAHALAVNSGVENGSDAS